MVSMHTRARRSSHSAILVAALALATAACGGEVDLESPSPGQPAPPEPASITVPATTAAPGSAIDVRVAGFTPGGTVQIGLGQPRSEYSVVREVTADADGRVRTTVQVPSWTTRGESYVIVATEPDHQPHVTSDPFVVGEAGDPIRIQGRVTDEGVECPAVRGPFGTLYTLAASDFQHGVGTEVTVEGTIAGASICMQGTTINVESVTAR